MLPPHKVELENELQRLTYLKWEDIYNKVKPYQVLMDVPEGVPRSNPVFEEGPEELVQDVRGRENDFNLDDHGFTFRKHVLQTTDFTKQTIEATYLNEVAQMLKRELSGANEVVCFNWQVGVIEQCSL